jgi:olefin beta-lactone synthetase
LNLEGIKNIAESLRIAATELPDQVAVAEPASRFASPPLKYRTITFRELDRRCDQIAAGVRRRGVSPGTKISLMVPPGIEFVTWVFGLLRAESTVILIDPGMGRKNMVRCLAEANPDGLAGILLAQAARIAFRKRLPNCKLNFVMGPRPLPLGQSTAVFFENNTSDPTLLRRDDKQDIDQPAAIIFTTGSTGPPKGVLYRHRHFIQQTIQIRDYFGVPSGGADVSGFPLFALFNTGMGMTTVFPKMDATRPASIVPENFIDAVEHFRANQSFGSPALWNTVSRFCEKHKRQMPTLMRVLTAGAPVPPHVLKRVRLAINSAGEVHTPYGATEALPVACIESRVVLGETAALSREGRGTCVGKCWPQINWQVIEITDQPIADISSARPLAKNEIGELIVSGPVVTDRYVTRTEANALHKIADGTRFWHRMGDVGYLDDQDRFWFCGRKSHRVQTATGTLFTIPLEAILNNHPAIYRSALVGVGKPGEHIPVLIVEPWPEHWPGSTAAHERLRKELSQLAAGNELTRSVQHVFLMKALPVDIRHNAKIFREKLAVWAAEKLAGRSNPKIK